MALPKSWLGGCIMFMGFRAPGNAVAFAQVVFSVSSEKPLSLKPVSTSPDIAPVEEQFSSERMFAFHALTQNALCRVYIPSYLTRLSNRLLFCC